MSLSTSPIRGVATPQESTCGAIVGPEPIGRPTVLLAGCGSKRDRRVLIPGEPEGNTFDWAELVTLDFNAAHKPDVLWDLEKRPLPFKDNEFDAIHLYEVLEHIGRQGDYRAFFAEFAEYWRILKADGLLIATTPSYKSLWAWGDPGHTRIFNNGTLAFLDQRQYELQVGTTPMSDYREQLGSTNFHAVAASDDGEAFAFVLAAKKP